MFTEAPKLKITNPSEFPSDVQVPPFVPKIYLQNESPNPGVITVIDQYDKVSLKASMLLTNTGGVPNTIEHRFPFVSGVDVPNRVILEADVELGASVTAALIAEDGTVFAVENDQISNTSSFFEFREMQVISVDVTKFPQNRPYFVSITTQLNAGRQASVSLVGTSSNFLPI